MKQHELLSYIYDFISQLVDNKIILDHLRRIILFGSAARGDFTKLSDIDLFIDVKGKETEEFKEIVKRELSKFEIRSEKSWRLRGINLPIKNIIGSIEDGKWADLKEEIISYGKILYGKFEQVPKEVHNKILILYSIKSLSQKNKMSLLRRLNGYTIKKRNKKYIQKGLINDLSIEKLSANTLLIEPEYLTNIKNLFKNYKIRYRIKYIWIK